MKKGNATKRGVITGLLMIVLSVTFFYGFKLPVNGDSQFVLMAVFVAGVLWSLFVLKSNAGATAGFKDYFSEGFKTFIVVTLLMAFFTFVFYKLNPQILENGIKENNILVMKEGNHTTAEIEENANEMRKIFMPMTLMLNIMRYLLTGAVISLIGAGFLSSKKAG